MVHVLVPYRTRRAPITGAAKDMDSAVPHIISYVLVNQTCCDNFRNAVAIHISDYGILASCTSSHLARIDVVWPDGVVACDVALAAGVDDAQIVVVAVHKFHNVVLVEVEQGHGRLSGAVVVILRPNCCQPALWRIAPTKNALGVAVGLVFEENNLGIRLYVGVADENITGAGAT